MRMFEAFINFCFIIFFYLLFVRVRISVGLCALNKWTRWNEWKNKTIFNVGPTKLVLTIAVISKGQQQQQKINELFERNKSNKNANVEIEQQNIKPGDPITFPDDDDGPPHAYTVNNIPSNQNINAILQSVEQNLPAPAAPLVELTRPTRVAVPAATSASITIRYSDDQLDYVRDFAWTMFQVGFDVQNVYDKAV